MKKQIIFDRDNMGKSYRFDEKPELFIERVDFFPDNQEWADTFSNGELKFELKRFDKNDRQLRKFDNRLSFGEYESVAHTQPSFELNELMEFGGKSTYNDDDYWILDITLQDLSLTTDKMVFSFEVK